MRYKALFSLLFLAVSNVGNAHWEKINDVDYTWGPFKIYNISLFTETGEYKKQTRPVMLTLNYSKPVDGRDFAISVAKSWDNLGIQLANQSEILDRLKKTLPDLKPNDSLSYIALEDRGYFVLNDQVIDLIFEKEFNEAMLAIWLGSKTDISRQLTTKKVDGTAQEVHYSDDYTPYTVEKKVEIKDESSLTELKDVPASTVQAVDSEEMLTTMVSQTTEGDLKAVEIITTKAADTNKSKAEEKTLPIQIAETKQTVADNAQSAQSTETAQAEVVAIKEQNTQAQNAEAQKTEEQKKYEQENPEKEILPIYDDLLMWQRLKQSV